MAIFITYTMTNMKSTLTYINHLHLVRVKEQSLTPQRYYLFLNLQIKSEIFYDFYEKKGRRRYHHDISLPEKNNTHY